MCWRPAPCNHDRALRYALPLDPRTGENEFTEINDTISTKLHEAGIPWTATSIQDRDLFSSRIIPGTDNKSTPYLVTVPYFLSDFGSVFAPQNYCSAFSGLHTESSINSIASANLNGNRNLRLVVLPSGRTALL